MAATEKYFDFEPPLADEGWTPVEVPDSTAERALHVLNGRGSNCLRVRTTVGDIAYVKSGSIGNLDPGEELYVGYWVNFDVMPLISYSYINPITSVGGTYKTFGRFYPSGACRWYDVHDGGSSYASYSLAVDRTFYIVDNLKRSTGVVDNNGWHRIFVDNQLRVNRTGVDNFNVLDPIHGDLEFRAGVTSFARDDFDMYLDEVKVSATYPEPYRPWQQGIQLSGHQPAVIPCTVGGYMKLRK